jgi:hypothetical protein
MRAFEKVSICLLIKGHLTYLLVEAGLDKGNLL